MTSPDQITIRIATSDDLQAIIALLADDVLGSTRESSGSAVDLQYTKAFAAIEADSNNSVLVAVADEEVVGCLQLTLIPHLNFQGGLRAQIEGVRVKSGSRGHGIGKRLINHAIEIGRQNECRMIQLTSNKVRDDAIRFYEQLGFEATHVGFKLYY